MQLAVKGIRMFVVDGYITRKDVSEFILIHHSMTTV